MPCEAPKILDGGETLCADEQSSVDILLSLTDKDGDELVFGQLISPEFSLSVYDGETILDFGDRPMTSLTIKLDGDDLKVFTPRDSLVRLLSFQGQYIDGDGATRDVTSEAQFNIRPQQAQPDVSI